MPVQQAEAGRPAPPPPLRRSGPVPGGRPGLAAAFTLSAVRSLDSRFRADQVRSTGFLLFVDPDRLLRAFRLNHGRPAAAQPCGGWEFPGWHAP